MSGLIPSPPRGLKSGGKRLWTAITSDFELDLQERLILLQICRIVDHLNGLDEVIRRQGMVEPVGGKPHPAMVESRQLSLALPRLLASLRLPDADDKRPQRRWSARGHYQRARGHQQEFIAAQVARLNMVPPA